MDMDEDAMASIDEDKPHVNDDDDVSMPTSLSRSACKRLASTHDPGDVAGGGGCACVSIKRKNMWRSSSSPRRDELSSLNSTYELELTRAGLGGGGGEEEEDEEEEKSDVIEN